MVHESMTLNEHINQLESKFEILHRIDLDQWHRLEIYERQSWLREELMRCYRPKFENNQRILLVLTQGDEYLHLDDQVGILLKKLQLTINNIDISNCFVILLTNDRINTPPALAALRKISTDPTEIEVCYFGQNTIEKRLLPETSTNKIRSNAYRYNSSDPVGILLEDLTDKEKFLLEKSDVFCMYPWVHIHAYPTGEAFPCCMADMKDGVIGNCKKNTLQEIWNSQEMKHMRLQMLQEKPHSACTRCYEKEKAGFFSGRRSANKHHGHHINRVHETKQDGSLDRFEIVYWDIRFSNLCNLSCRSCGHIFSSSWYRDQVKLAGPDWAKKNKSLNIAGRDPMDMWNQLLPHIDYVEQIYFAGGEPLMMDEHYRILEELECRGRFDVRLIYNTNFTQTKLKDRYVFDYWRKFDSVSVGASLDAMDSHAEYIRHGTDWQVVEETRRKMLESCPNVDFYISPTLSILNAWHLPDFHKSWVEKGLIRAQDLNVNVLQDPAHYRIDIAPIKYKQRLRVKFEEHLEWLRPQDKLNRATVGFESAINFMMATDNSKLIPTFWQKTHQLDEIRNEQILTVIPELEALDADTTR